MGYAIGIDIGTANTRVAIYRDGKIEVIPDKDGERSMPSYVAFTERCPLFGNAAKARAASNPRNTVYGTKRILGQHLKQWLVGRYTRISPNDVSIESPRKMTISVSYRKHPHSLSLLQVFGMLLRRARANAETHLGEIVQDAVISVPVHFNKLQRLCVYDAALSAGINVQRIDSSIESIALYCAFITPGEGDTLNICVLDFGAGFFNVGLVGIYEKVVEVLSVASDKDLGGEDLIDRVYNHFATAIQEKWNWVINMDICARHRLRAASVAAMKELSSTASTRVYIDSLYGGQDFDQRLSRQTLEQKCEDLFHAMLTPIEKSLREAVVNKSSVQEIVMAGGCSRIPKVQEVLADSFDSKPLVRVVNPNESEVIGSALHAAILSQRPDQTVDDLTLLSSEPFDIGLGIGGKMSTISPRNTTIPSSKLREYRLCDLGLVLRERPVLHFYQGHERRVKDNYFIGTLDLSELLSGRDHGVSETNISIKVSIDADQNVFASAFVNPEGRWTSTEAWKSAVQSNGDKIRALLWQVEDYRMDEVREEEIAEKRHALYLRLASLGDIELPSFQTNRMRGLLGSLGPLRDRLDGLEFESFDEHEEFDKALDTVERDLKNEVLRGKEIMGLRSHAEELRAKLLATIQTPKTGALLRSIGGVTRWVDQNEEAAIQDYQAKLRSLTAISLELTTLSEASSGRDSTPSVASPQRSENSTSTQMDRPRSLEELFHGSNADPKSKFTDAEFEDIASYLRNTNHQSWSKVPRVYTVLRLIGQVELVDAFLQHDMSDIWFPFSDNTLPRVLKQPRRAQFLNAQEAVFSKALELEKGTRFDDQKSHRKHAHFSQSEPLPFEVKGNSGSGAHGIVDKVVSTLSYKEYARKRFKRSAINKKYVGSYSDPRYFALIMHPVAECNLEKYYSLALDDLDKRSVLQGFFGCLASTLDYLHKQKVVHQDIKPQNILVKDNSHVLVTDFGIARSWEGLTRATTTADLDRTWVYAAPEVARGGPKNETADVWSLGCVFLEMFTVLKGQSPADMRAFFKGQSDSTSFHDNAAPGHTAAWDGSLRERSPPELNEALDWVDSMLQVEPRHRCRPSELFDKTVNASESTSVLFCGACCRDRSESAPGSNDEHTDRWSEGDDEDI